MPAKEEITIAGQIFNVPNPYLAGHTCTAGEADALNQTFHEAIRNNLAKKAKEGNLTQDEVDDYASRYEFGVRKGGGGGPRDPVRTRAMDIARDKVKGALRKKYGKDAASFSAKQISSLAQDALEKHPEWVEIARQQIQEEAQLAEEALDDVIEGVEPNPEPETDSDE
jgi:hypothetical protein